MKRERIGGVMRRSGVSVAARVGRLACVAGLSLSLSACFRPLYGPTASGESMQALLASVQVDDVAMAQGQERLGHYLRSELIFDLDGSGQPASKRYRLKLSGAEVVQTPIVSSTTGRAEAGTIVANIRYSLEDLAGVSPAAAGVVESLRAEVVELRTRRDGLADLIAEGLLPPAAAREQAGKLGARIGELEDQLQRAAAGSPAASLTSSDDVAGAWSALPLKSQRDVVRTLMTVTIEKAGRGARFEPDQVSIEWSFQ